MFETGKEFVKLAEAFVQAPCFSLAFGTFAKLYEDDGHAGNQKSIIFSKLLQLCSTLHHSRVTTCELLNRTAAEGTKSLKSILTCCFCNHLYFHPTVLFCGHTFCRKCLDVNLTCHYCFSPTTTGEVSDSLLLTKAVEHFCPETRPLYSLLDEEASMVRQGRYVEASAVHDKMLSIYPTNPRCLQAKAEAYFLTSDFGTALDVTNRALQLYPDWPKFHCLKGRCLSRLNRRREALEHYFKCLTVYPKAECLVSEITQILEDVIVQSDIVKWKEIVELCVDNPDSITQILTDLPDDLGATVRLEPWMRFTSGSSSRMLNCETLYKSQSIPIITDDICLTKELHESIHAEFQCALCLRLFLFPTGLPCGHTFCQDCIERSLDYKSECPLCKNTLCEYLSSPSRSYCLALWKLVKYLFPKESSDRQLAWDRENLTLSRVGIDPHLEMPVMVCCLAYPGIPCPLHICEPRYRNMVRRAVTSGSRRFGLFISGEGPLGLSEIGVVLRINDCQLLPDGRMLIDTRGCCRVRVLRARVVEDCINVNFEFYADCPLPPDAIEDYRSLSASVYSMAANWLSHLPCNTRASLVPFFGGLPSLSSPPPEPHGNGAPAWVWWLTAVLPLGEKCRYKLLCCQSPDIRMELLKGILIRLTSENWKTGEPSQVLSC